MIQIILVFNVIYRVYRVKQMQIIVYNVKMLDISIIQVHVYVKMDTLMIQIMIVKFVLILV